MKLSPVALMLTSLSFATLASTQVALSQTAPLPASVRVTAAVDDTSLVTLGGNTNASLPQHADQGRLPASAPAGTLRLLLRRDATRETELRRFLDDVGNPHSPQYHKWLTPQEYGSRFGIADEDLGAVKTWLEREGFTIRGVPGSRNFVEFSGTVGQVEQAFHTSLHTYSIHGAQYVRNANDPKIPAALAPVVSGVSSLNTLRARAQQTLSNPAPGRWSSSHAAPSATPLVVGQTALYITPADAATIYNSPNTLNRNFKSGSQQTGSGVNIGIAGYSDLPTADYLNYRKLFLNESAPMQPTLIVDGVDPGTLDQHDGQITLIDTEIAAGLAPQANIYVYSSQSDLLEDGLTDAVIRAVEDNFVAILSVSYARCEDSLGASGNLQWNEILKQASAQGISVVVAAGDSGAGGCDASPAATSGLAVSGFASTPYAVAVGGTDFDALGSNFSTYVDTANVNSTPPYRSFVTGYIPENPWNASISNNPPGPLSTNVAGEFNFGMGPTTILSAGGGGASSQAFCATSIDPTTGNCLSPLTGYPAPPFQSGVNAGGTASGGVRYLPDVALFAGTSTLYPAIWAVCSDNFVAQANYTFTDCNPAQDGSYSVEGAGGTGTSTAAFAGILGMVLQSLGPNSRIGVADNVLYNLYAGASRASVFHDVTVGNNSVPCMASSLNCDSNNFLNGYDAAPGYDLASGMGSVDVSALITAWPTAVFAATNTTLSANGAVVPLTIQHGNSVTLAASVTPTAATGFVSVTGLTGQGGAAVQENIPLLGGAGSISTGKLPGGSYTVQGYYPGDVNDSASTSSPAIQITVTPENSALQLTTKIVNINTDEMYTSSFPYGAYGYVYVRPVSANPSLADASGPATGMVTLLNHGTPLSFPGAPSGQILNSVGKVAFPLQVFTPGTYSLGATYGGDKSYNASSTTSDTAITIQKSGTRIMATPPSASIDVSATATVTVTLDSDSTGLFPSGAITLSANGMTFPGTTQQVLTTLNAVEEVATFQVAGSALAAGANTVTATYGGDANYNGSSTTVMITVTGSIPKNPGSPGGPPNPGIPTFSLTGPVGGITVPTLAASATGIVNVDSVNGFAGTIALSCTLTGTTGMTGAKAPTCSVTPSVALQSQSSATATVTINPVLVKANTVSQASTMERYLFPIRAAQEGGLALCSTMLCLVPVRRRARRSLSIFLLAVGVLGIVGCGVHRNQVMNQPGNYTAVITGTSGTIVVTTQIPVVIQ